MIILKHMIEIQYNILLEYGLRYNITNVLGKNINLLLLFFLFFL